MVAHPINLPVEAPAPTPNDLTGSVGFSFEAFRRDPAAWHGRDITVEGDWIVGFECSRIESLWITVAPRAEKIGESKPQEMTDRRTLRDGGCWQARVRATGRVDSIRTTSEQSAYGHAGGYAGELATSRFEFQEPWHRCPPPDPTAVEASRKRRGL